MPIQYKLTKQTFKAHYDVMSTIGEQFYVVINTKLFSPKMPTLSIHAGNNASAPVVGASFRTPFGETYKLAFGDYTADPPWEDMVKSRLLVFEYKWSALLPSMIESGTETRRTFIWKRTTSVGVDGSLPLSWSPRNWKLVQEDDDTVLAVFTAERALGKCGTLQINVDWTGFNDKVVLTLVSIYHRTVAGGG